MKKRSRKMLYFSLAGMLLLLGILLGSTEAGSPDEPEPAKLPLIILSGEYKGEDGPWQKLETGSIPKGYHTISIRGHFEQEIPENETIWLRMENIGITFCLNGRQIFECFQPGSFPDMFHAPGYAWYSLRSPGISREDVVEITIRNYYDGSLQNTNVLLDSFYMGDGSGLYRMMAENVNLITVIILLAMTAGAIYLLEGIIYKFQKLPESGRITLLGFYCFSGGLWCITESFYPWFSLLITPPWLASVIDMSGPLLFPVAMVLLVRNYLRGKTSRRTMNAAALLAILFVSFSLVLQIAGIVDLHQQQKWIGSAALVMLTVTLSCIATDLIQYRDRYILLLYLAVLPAAAAMLADSMNIWYAFMPRRIMMRYGFTLSVLLMISQIVSYGKAENEARKRLQRTREELDETKISVMISKIQPHFLYNALNTIMSLCYTDGKKAGDTVASFAKYLRGNLDAIVNSSSIPFTQELAHLENYITIEKLRFPDISFVFELNAVAFKLPPLTLQPLVDNAVRYGGQKKNITVRVFTCESETDWCIKISDDGAGFDPAEDLHDGRSHVGISNTRERVSAMCGGTLKVESTIGAGTVVTVTIPKGGDTNEDYLRGR